MPHLCPLYPSPFLESPLSSKPSVCMLLSSSSFGHLFLSLPPSLHMSSVIHLSLLSYMSIYLLIFSLMQKCIYCYNWKHGCSTTSRCTYRPLFSSRQQWNVYLPSRLLRSPQFQGHSPLTLISPFYFHPLFISPFISGPSSSLLSSLLTYLSSSFLLHFPPSFSSSLPLPPPFPSTLIPSF